MPTSVGQWPKYRKNIAIDKLKPIKYLHYFSLLPQENCNHLFAITQMNSTFLDVENKFYTHKGHFNAQNLYFFSFAFAVLVVMPFYYFVLKDFTFDLFSYFIGFLFVLPIFILYPLLTNYKPDNGNYTHFPIRFNRKNRKVYFLDMQGNYQSEDWKKMKFCIVQPNSMQGDYEIWGFILNKDTQLIEHTVAIGPAVPSVEALEALWSMICIYIDEGPEVLYPHDLKLLENDENKIFSKVTFCNDIVGKKETKAFSYYRVNLNSYGSQFFYYLRLLLLESVFWKWGRLYAMWTCKIPVWPDWILNECHVEDNDPFIVDASINQYFDFDAKSRRVYLKNLEDK